MKFLPQDSLGLNFWSKLPRRLQYAIVKVENLMPNTLRPPRLFADGDDHRGRIKRLRKGGNGNNCTCQHWSNHTEMYLQTRLTSSSL